MKSSFVIMCVLLAALLPGTGVRAADSDTEVQARNAALDLAGAFSNDGFKIRDGHWSGHVAQGDQALIAVNLYAGNQYWFSVGADQPVQKVTVQLYDENGRPVQQEGYAAEDKFAAGFSPTVSGEYFLAIAPKEGDAKSYCLVYSYK